ncbi:MAG: threonine synthase, partial [Bacteroidota bacterium]|nr:threonine synthase [Bacteroidota bacterium]
ILELFKHEYPEVKNVVSSYSITDDVTKATLKNALTQYKYLLDPHGAVAFAGLEKYLEQHAGEKGIILETAHPVKFYDVVELITGQKVETPDSIKGVLDKKKQRTQLPPDYEAFRQFLLS